MMVADPRTLELKELANLSDGHPQKFAYYMANTYQGRILVHLLSHDFVVPEDADNPSLVARLDNPLDVRERRQEHKWRAIQSVMLGQMVVLKITHAGAVRAAELRDQLAFGRIREPMGLIWDGRHFQRDASIAMLDATKDHPLAVAYFDLNEMKRFNEKGHDRGDLAIKTYLSHVALTFDRHGDAYRLSGGADEVVVLMPHTQSSEAVSRARRFLRTLGEQSVEGITLRAAGGVVVAFDRAGDVEALKKRADEQQGRAKTLARGLDSCPSCLAWEGSEPEVVMAGKSE